MLIGIPPILGPELLSLLRGMGHGDEIALVDGNYPALEHARRLVRADGVGLLPMLEAILTVIPLDSAAPAAVFRAGWLNDPKQHATIHEQIDATVARMTPDFPPVALTGESLYARIRAAHAIVATSEPQLYGNVVLRKGVIAPIPGKVSER